MFLILALASTAFLAGYIMVRNGFNVSPDSKTGTILAKFSGSEESSEGAAKGTGEPGMPVLLTEKQVISVTNSLTKDSILFFEKNTGKLYELNLTTTVEETVLNNLMTGLIGVIWSPTKKEAIGSFISGQETIFKNFDTSTGREESLDPNIFSISFSPDGGLVAYHYLDTSSSTSQGKIVISEPDGSYQKKIINTRLESVAINWPLREKIALKTINSEILLLTEDGKLSSILGPLAGLEEKWSPSGGKLLYSSREIGQETATLFTKNIDTGEERSLGAGSASTCAWSIDDVNVFCATPKSPSIDVINKINTLDGSKELIVEPEMQIKQMMFSSGEDYLLIVTPSDNLYAYKLSL